jgi:2-dehydro-3-deoxyphosphogluconate aldolase/(4S)-4-hydroxy-2-oxoglutarate aldolase
VLENILKKCRVLPVVTPASVEGTVRLAQALQRGGMAAIEITLRSTAALDSIRAVKERVPDMLVAAGTVTNATELQRAASAGATLVLSPGATPGVATASEVMVGMDHGFSIFKLFPAEAAGGLALLKSLAGPFPQLRFCPTGGLHPGNFRDYLDLPNVICCGGSWMVRADLVDNCKWDEIEALAREAMAY